MWGSSITGVFKVRLDKDKMVPVGYLYRDINFSYHGAYAFLSAEDVYFIAGESYIAAYTNKNQSDPESPIVLVKKFDIPNLHSDEHLVGLSLTFDDYMVYVTNYGKCGVLSKDFKFQSNVVQLPGLDEVQHKSRMVSNSFALDKNGGIYIVNSMFMNKAQWDVKSKNVTLIWSTRYHDVEQEIYWGRFGPGSGASPTLMGDKA